MVDRENRNKLLAILDDYLSGKIKTSAFMEQCDTLKTDDRTVRHIVFLTWFHHDDLIDHPVKLTRQQWNFFQRLRLILQSDAEFARKRAWNFTVHHAVILAGVALLVIALCYDGLGWKFWSAYTALGTIVLCFIRFYRSKAERHFSEITSDFVTRAETEPFQNFSIMRDVYESVGQFHKMPYPLNMDLTPLRSKRTHLLMHLPCLVYWPMFALLTLLTFRAGKYAVRLPHTEFTL